MRSGFRLGKVFGINIFIDWSWIFIFLLVTWNLAGAVFPSLHPDWDTTTNITLGIVASLLFFLSVLLHELAHSLVAKASGLPVRRITLFFFGGVSNIEREPPSPKTEFLMAIVGPLTSIGLGILFTWLGRQSIPAMTTGITNPLELLRGHGRLPAGHALGHRDRAGLRLADDPGRDRDGLRREPAGAGDRRRQRHLVCLYRLVPGECRLAELPASPYR